MLPLDGLVLDMDGVLWRGSEPLPGLVPFFDTLHRRRIEFLLATNNSTRTLDQFVDTLAGMGVQIRPEQVINRSLESTLDFLGLSS